MGPRPFSRGNVILTLALRMGEERFNGATAFQPWKPLFRGLSCPRSPLASMGPRPFSRGNSFPTGEGERLRDRFNGATAFQPWKRA